MQSTVEDSVDAKPEMPIRFLELTKLTSKDVATSAVGFNNCVSIHSYTTTSPPLVLYWEARRMLIWETTFRNCNPIIISQ